MYCYVRKNACSAFKQFIVRTSPFAKHVEDFASPIKFFLEFHSASLADVAAADHSILIVREPAERINSAYLNKFVKKGGHENVAESYRCLAGVDTDKASLLDVINDYLRFPLVDLDSHFWPQTAHLAPVVYSDAWPIE